MAFKMDDYVDVAERLAQFYAKFKDGRITRGSDPEIMEVGGRLFVVYTARAYRTPDDPVPAVGTAWEPFPGGTPYTKDSELMNAETAAWGRAIIAAGIPSKKIASKEEVQNRQPAPAPVKPETIPAEAVKVLYGQVSDLIDTGALDANKIRLILASVGVKDAKTIKTALASLTPAMAKALQAQLDGAQSEQADKTLAEQAAA